MSNVQKIGIAVIAAVLILALIAGIVTASFVIAQRVQHDKFAAGKASEAQGKNKIHFLNTGGSDAILLESDGKFAMVDCAEDTDNPRNFPGLELKGYEEQVLQYVKQVAADESGNVHLEFIVGTHAHSDHIGGFDTLLNDPAVHADKAYVKAYDASHISDYEQQEWDNQEVFDQLIAACEQDGTQVVHDLPQESFMFGEMKITLMNTEIKTQTGMGENENSLGVLIEVNDRRVFLAGDINNILGDEDALGKQLGKVDVLKLGHHGYLESSSDAFLRALHPDIAIVTNDTGMVHAQAKIRLISQGSAIFGTVDEDGILMTLDGDSIRVYSQLSD